MPRIQLHWQILAGMLIGAGVGLTLNYTVGNRHTVVENLPDGIKRLELHDSSDLVEITITPTDGEPRTVVVDGTHTVENSVPTLTKLKENDPEAFGLFHKHGRSWARWVGDSAYNMGSLFLRMLRMVAVPLIVTSLVTGVMGLGHAERLGRMFVRTLTYYICTSLLAIVTGLLMVNIIRPGLDDHLLPKGKDEPGVTGDIGAVLFSQLETMIPSNPIGALAEGNFLSIICFSLAFAIFAVIVGGRTAELMRDFFSAGFEVMMAMTMAIIKLAPLGVLFLMLYVTATHGAAVFVSLAWYMLTVLLALVFHAAITLPMILYFVARRNPLDFARAMSPALLTAFSSASSNGTLPLTLASVEERAGVSNRVSSFVLPLGATVNMDGTALYEAVAVLFIAQLWYGPEQFSEHFPIAQQIIVAFTALLASIGAAGIPHAGLVMMVIILQAVGLPVEMQGIIIAVDRVLDMCRTSVNVWSDSCGCAVIARYETHGGRRSDEVGKTVSVGI
jgi:Na+/H+-dicarboxylate symporter